MKTPASKLPPFAFTSRDFLILLILAMYGALGAVEISTLLWWKDPKTWKDEPHTNCQKRLLLLYQHGYVSRIELPYIPRYGRKPLVHILNNKGARALAHHLGCELGDLQWRKVDPRTGGLFLEHLLSINKVRVAIAYAIEHLPFTSEMVSWIDDSQLRSKHSAYRMDWEWPAQDGKSRKKEKDTVLIPDGYFHIRTIKDQILNWHHMIEIDRGTETITSRIQDRHTWLRKILMYEEFYKKDGYYQQVYDENRKGRILVITTTDQRLANLKKIVDQFKIKARFRFTTMNRVTPLSVFSQPIWQIGGIEGEHFFFEARGQNLVPTDEDTQ